MSWRPSRPRVEINGPESMPIAMGLYDDEEAANITKAANRALDRLFGLTWKPRTSKYSMNLCGARGVA